MSKETERVFREFQKFIGDKELNEEELNKAFKEFIDSQNNIVEMGSKRQERPWDYLEMAYEADNEKDALKYAKKALKLDKNCLDAEVMIADLTTDNPEELKLKYEKLIKKAEKYLKEQNLLNEEDVGHFWGILETRPYMRLRDAYLRDLVQMGKFRKAMKEAEDLLVLSENDNLGVRYTLISLYALYEDEVNALKLYKKYKEDTTQMLLPIIVMYYKMDNYKRAETYLKKLNGANRELVDFFCQEGELDEEEMFDIVDSGMYAPYTKEEVMIAISQTPYLYGTAASSFLWISQKLALLNDLV